MRVHHSTVPQAVEVPTEAKVLPIGGGADVRAASAAAAAPPPACNTGVEISQEGVDYLSLSHSDPAAEQIVMALLLIDDDDWVDLQHGGYGFRSCREAFGVRLYADGGPAMGLYVQISGDGCRELEARGVVTDWQQFAQRCIDFGMTCKRIDFFRDDRSGQLDIRLLSQKMEERAVATHARDHQLITSGRIGRGPSGVTLRIGKRQSETMMRIYDKALEQMPASVKPIDRRAWLERYGHHVRAELELKGKRAVAALARLAAGGLADGLIPGLMRAFVDFKEYTPADHNKSRVPTLAAWSLFLSAAGVVRLAIDFVTRTLAEVEYHLERQWAPMVATLMTFYGGDLGFLVGLASRGRHRMRKRHARLLAAAA